MIIVPDGLKGKELVKFLKLHKAALISEKKSLPVKHTEAISFTPAVFNIKGKEAQKTSFGEIPADANSFRVKVVANACWWCDSQMDVLVDDSAKDSIKQRKPLIKHLRDHEYKLAAEVGDVVDIYLQDISLTELGLSQPGTTQCVIFETDIRKDYDSTIFNKYKAGKINQHSIGLQYIRIELAYFDEEDEKEMDFWNKYFPRIINKEFVEERGYFFVVPEYKLLENSAVLFGSNELTPTLEVGKDTIQQPAKTTAETPSPVTSNLLQKINETKFITV